MKTTLELPDDLMRAIKIQAAEENRRLKDVVAELLRRGLDRAPRSPGGAPKRVRFPLVRCAHGARPETEMTPERVAEILVGEEAAREPQSVR